jgi:4-amino-4-deoxy-L-arabinose transferase-like glycosyltransferase
MKSSWVMKSILIVILGCALFLRTYNIAKNPPSLSWDEVSIGYNAYSILKTGKDEHGQFMPVAAFAAYGDYKPPFAIYATVPFVALFGLNELAVRLPSALFGTVTIFLTYYLVSELLLVFQKKSKKENAFGYITWLPMVSAALLAISPWHINISRAGFEANIALFFVVLGIYVLLRALSNPRYWLVAWLPFVVAAYTFNSSRYFVPMFGLVFCIWFWKVIRANLKWFAMGVVIAGVAMLPILPHLLSKEAGLRFTEVNIFTDSSIVTISNARIAQEHNSLLSKIVNNRRVGYARSFLIHFFDNLQPDFLFVTGDGNPKFSIQDVGQLYIFEAPFLAIGIFAMFLSYPQLASLLLFWLLAAIIPAATARETPHALRILNSLPTWQVFVAFGILQTLEYVGKLNTKNVLFRNLFIALLIVLYCCGVTYYLYNYYRHYPTEYSGEWQYGYKQALERISGITNQYDRVVITDSIGRPYMYTLFYTKTDPRELFRTIDSSFDAAGFYHVYGFANYHFPSSLPLILTPRTLYIWNAGMAPKNARVLDTIRLLNGDPVLEIFDSGDVKI